MSSSAVSQANKLSHLRNNTILSKRLRITNYENEILYLGRLYTIRFRITTYFEHFIEKKIYKCT